MLMKRFLLTVAILTSAYTASKADEGMWMLTDLKEQNATAMMELGLQIPVESIYNPDSVSLKDAVGEISAETVMAYPPGIPLVIPGELVDRDVVRMIEFYYRENGQVLKDSEPRKMKVIDRSRWYLAQEYPFL